LFVEKSRWGLIDKKISTSTLDIIDPHKTNFEDGNIKQTHLCWSIERIFRVILLLLVLLFPRNKLTRLFLAYVFRKGGWRVVFTCGQKPAKRLLGSPEKQATTVSCSAPAWVGAFVLSDPHPVKSDFRALGCCCWRAAQNYPQL
jgi:hypothetical protein